MLPAINYVRSLRAEIRYRTHRTHLMMPNLSRRPGSPLHPALIQIQTINRCNGHCAFCPYPETVATHPQAEMPEALYQRLLTEIASWRQRGVLVLTFQNEPLLDPRTADLIRMAKAMLGRDWEIEITTNATRLTPASIDALAAAGTDMINVSLNALTPSTYERLMPGFSFAEVQTNILRLLQHPSRVPVSVRFVKTRWNQQEFRAFRRYWRSQGAIVIGYDCNDRLGSVRQYDDLQPPVSLTRRLWRRCAAPLLFRACPFPWSQANIRANGDVLYCCHDYADASRIGNITTHSLSDIFNSSAYQRLRQSFEQGRPQTNPALCAHCRFHQQALWL